MSSPLEQARMMMGTLTNPAKLRMFVAVTMDLGLEHTMGVHGTRRIRKKRLKRLFKRAAYESLIDALKEARNAK